MLRNRSYLIIIFVILAFLFDLGLYDFLLFHTVVEIFSIIIAVMISVLGIGIYKDSHKLILLYFGYSYLFIALLDLLHLITFKGMNIVPGATHNISVQFWIIGRFLEATTFPLALHLVNQKPSKKLVFASYLLVTMSSIIIISCTHWFPVCYVDGSGLTPFKIVCEYIICFLLTASIVYTYRSRHCFQPIIYKLLIAAMISFVVSELSFTLYTDVNGFFNTAGHIFRTITYMLIFNGILINLRSPYLKIKLAYDETLRSWAQMLELRDLETKGHSERVTSLTTTLARYLRLNAEDIIHIAWGALLHDIGKIGIPDSILLKEGSLTDEERKVMQKHPQYAFDIIQPIKYLAACADIPHYHHEKWDGTGYPCGLKGKEIPLFARLFAIVDVWDALRSDRPYRAGWSHEQCCKYIRENSGKHFDPDLVEPFLTIVNANRT